MLITDIIKDRVMRCKNTAEGIREQSLTDKPRENMYVGIMLQVK